MTARIVVAAAGMLVLAAVAPTRAYEERPVADAGSITGSVRLIGEVPVLPPQPVYKQAEYCGEAVRDDRLVTGNDGRLANAVVALTDIRSGKAISRDVPAKLDNVKCAFVPHVVAAVVGQTLEIHNDDPFLHDAHAWLGTTTLFNVAIPKGRTVSRTLDKPGIAHLNCNVRHTWMHAYLYIAENPYFAVTGPQGEFSLDGVPPGTYTVQIWHELLGTTQRQVTVESGKPTHLDVELPLSAEAVKPSDAAP